MVEVKRTKFIDKEFEFVERKGLGHPDTICDAIAETASKYYSQYFFKKYGRYAHHWFDKVMLIGGESVIKYGKGSLVKPYEVIFAGKCVKRFMQQDVPLKVIFKRAASEILGRVLYKFDPEKDLIIIDKTVDYTGSSRKNIRYQPEIIEDLIEPNCKSRVSNDCNLVCGYAPYSKIEQAVKLVENYYTDISYRDKHPEIGSDIKLVGTRENNEYNLLVNMPFIADYISNYNDYIDKSKKIICEIKNMLKEKIGIECKIDFNPSDRENKPYLTSLGSAADTGDVGVVGRGNRINGLITPMRCMSIEAPAGKNPIDHTGKLYGILAHRLANEIFKITNCFVEIHIYVSKSTDIFKPEKIVINIDDRGVNFDDETIKRLVNDYFSSMNNLTKELVDEGICLW